VNRGLTLGALSAIVLLVILWFIWPRSPNDRSSRILTFKHPSEPVPAMIDPPFDFYWGDSAAHVKALLEYSSAEILMRTATGQGETWLVEGLTYPGLKQALFSFDRNALTSVEMLCQYDAWTADQYRSRLETLRSVFDDRYGERHRANSRHSGPEVPNNVQNGYTWQVGNTYLSVVCRSSSPSENKRTGVSDLVLRYDTEPTSSSSQADRWSDNVTSPLVAQKLQLKDSTAPPAGSDLGITNAKLLNTSIANETALSLQLAVTLDSDSLPDPTKAVVAVNFYDTLADGEIVLTDARVNYDWRSRRDWKENNPETIAVGYVREGSAARSARKYFGYVATVYFDGRLESVRAEPVMLVNLFPVRTFISPFENAQAAVARGDYPTAARLYRTAAEQGNLFALENLAWFYANGKGVTKDLRQAALAYERAALQNTPRALNSLAWFLATCQDDSIRNGVEAVRHATQACELTYWQEWKYIDTLAAAWAENGDFKRAIEYEQQALGVKSVDEEARAKMEDRIALYRKRQSVRD